MPSRIRSATVAATIKRLGEGLFLFRRWIRERLGLLRGACVHGRAPSLSHSASLSLSGASCLSHRHRSSPLPARVQHSLALRSFAAQPALRVSASPIAFGTVMTSGTLGPPEQPHSPIQPPPQNPPPPHNIPQVT